MKTTLKTWFVGFMILTPTALFSSTKWLISEIDALWFTDHHPIWWSLACLAINLTACFLIPLFAVINAKQCLRALTKQIDGPDYYSEAVAEIKMKNELNKAL